MKRVTKSSAKAVVKKFLEEMRRKRKTQQDLDSGDQSKSATTAIFKFFPSEGSPNVTIEDHSTYYVIGTLTNVTSVTKIIFRR